MLAGLSRLAEAGLAHCDEDGSWTSHEVEQATESAGRTAETEHLARTERIEAERAAYAEVRAGYGPWHRQREHALRRGAVARLAGARRWWDSLEADQQQQRRSEWTQRYRALDPAEQRAYKAGRAELRQRAGGLTEDQLHHVWAASIPGAEYHSRAAERARLFRGLHLEQQRALVASWESHRDRWGIQRRTPPPAAASGPVDYAQVLATLQDEALVDVVRLLEGELGARELELAYPRAAPRKESA